MTGAPERSGTIVSLIGHFAFVALVFAIAGARPFESSPAEAISVDLVPAAEVPKPEPKPESKPKPDTPLDWTDKREETAAPPMPASQPQASAPAPSQQAPIRTPVPSSPSRPAQQAATAQTSQPLAPPPQPAPVAQLPAAAPDISERYGVMMGLPDNKPAGFDALAIDQADIGSNFSAQFLKHLKTCSVLPTSISRADNVKVTLRVAFTTDGRLAGPPTVVEASASEKGPLLMQASIKALMACQPYAMLPSDKYKEWRVLDLKFTPADFNS